MKLQGNELIINGVVASIDRDNIDTDQIIPTEYLKSIKKYGFEDYLFDGWRYLDEGKLGISKDERKQNPDFILNKDQIDNLFKSLKDASGELSISLDSKKISQNDKELYAFDVEENLLERIIYGLDDVDMTLKFKDKIASFEQERKQEKPWIFSND